MSMREVAVQTPSHPDDPCKAISPFAPLRRDAAVGDESCARHEGGGVRGQEHDALGDVVGVTMRPIGKR